MTNDTQQTAIEQQYFEWLYGLVGDANDQNPRHTYWVLAEIFHGIDFYSSVNHDENRAADGLVLRDDFCDEVGSWDGSSYPFGPCSFFEAVIAICRRAAYEAYDLEVEDTVEGWFWIILRNLDLLQYTDDAYSHGEWTVAKAKRVVRKVLRRQYEANGQGGMFPLKRTKTDQAQEELWFQMMAYILENSNLID